MRLHRHWIALALAGCLGSLASPLAAQETSDLPSSSTGGTTTAPSGSTAPATPFGSSPGSFGGSSPVTDFGSGAASSFGSPTQPAGTGLSPVPTIPGTGPNGVPPFGTTPTPSTGNNLTGGLSGSSPAAYAAPSFTAPGAYGQATQTFTAGQGRLARPHFQYTGSLSFGYDDNTNSTPYNGVDTPAVFQKVLVSAAIPDQFVTVTPPVGNNLGLNTRPVPVTIRIPGQDAVYKKVEVSPAVPAAKVQGSFVARANASASVQFSSRRSVFTMDLNGSASYYPSRTPTDHDLNGSLSLVYLRRITPRLQFSANANIAYLSQPDLTLVNAPTVSTGDYLNLTSKYDLTYRFSPRLSNVTSLSFNSQYYTTQTNAPGTFYEIILGTEGRYLFSPRVTLLSEVRVSEGVHPNASALDSSTFFVLAGAEVTFSRKLSGVLRVGQEFKTFTESGSTRSGPYVEGTVSYRYSRAGTVALTTRLGFEEPPDINTTVEVLRSSISALQAFSARTRGTVSLSAVHRLTEQLDGGATSVDNTFQVSLGLEYTLSRHSTLTANYDFTNTLSTAKGSDYLRNQIFFGMQYTY